MVCTSERKNGTARGGILAGAAAIFTAAAAFTGPAHGQQPPNCNSPSIGASLSATVAPGDIIPPGQPVIPGQQVTYYAGVFVSPNPLPPSTIVFCDVVGGQLSVTLPNWMASPHGQRVEVAGFPSTPAITQFGNTAGPFVAEVPLVYVVNPAHASPSGFLNARVDYGQTAWLNSQGILQQSGMVLTGLTQEGNADTSSSIRMTTPAVRIEIESSVGELCVGETAQVLLVFRVQNMGSVDLTNITVTDALTNPSYFGGDDGDGLLNPGEIWVYTAITTVSGGTSTSASVSAAAVAFNGVVIDTIEYTGNDTISIVSNPRPSIAAVPTSAAVCPGESQQFCATVGSGLPPYMVQWRNPQGTVIDTCYIALAGGTCCLTASGPGTYTATVTDGHGCTYEDDATLQLNTPPAVAVDPASQVCPGNAATFCATAAGGQGPYTYAWSGPGGYNSSASCINVSTPGSYCVFVTDAHGCQSASACTSLNVSSPVTASVNPSGGGSICAGAQQTMCAVPAGGSGPYTFQWSGPGTFSSSSPCINVSTAGNYCVLITDANGCRSPLTCAPLVVNTPPTLAITPASSQICSGQQQTFTANPQGGTAPYTYAWTGPGNFTSAAPAITVSAPGNYCLTITDANGCASAQACSTLAQGGNFTCDITGPAGVCQAVEVQYCAPPGLEEYDWTVTGNATIVDDDGHCIRVMPTGQGGYTVSLTATDALECACSDVQPVVVGEGPTLALEVGDDLCVKPGTSQVIMVDLHMKDVAAGGVPLTAFQAFVTFDAQHLSFLQGVYTLAPFGMPVVPIQQQQPGVILLAAGLAPGQLPTLQDAKLATLVFAVTSGDCDTVSFDFDDSLNQPNLLTGAGAISLQPCLMPSDEVLIDDEAPRIVSCCALLELSAGDSCQQTLPDLTDCANLQIVDDCLPMGKLSISQFPPAGTTLGLGSTWVTIIVEDCAGNGTTCQVKVLVEDTTPPDLSCPPDRTLKADNDCRSRVPDLRGQISRDDNCDNPALLTITQVPPPDTAIGLGQTIVIITATDDAGNSSTCDVQLTVIDARPPVIQCPHDITLEANEQCQAPLPDRRNAAVIVDNCTIRPLLIVAQTPPPGTMLPVGTHTVEIRIEDQAGNEAICTFEVTVVDASPPSIDCPGNLPPIPVNGNCQALVPRIDVTANDPCSDFQVEQDPPAGHLVVGLGSITITVTATNEHGQSDSCQVKLETVDKIDPTILDCSNEVKIPADGDCGAFVPQMTGGVVAVDNCTAPDELEIEQTPAPGTRITQLGRTRVTITVRDESGNEATCNAIVEVLDDTPPVLDCPENITAECTGDKQAEVGFDISAKDDCDDNPLINCFRLNGAGAPVGIVNPDGTKFPQGRTIVLCQARDNVNNFSFCLFSVTVVDTTPPDLTCPPARTVAADDQECEFEVPDLLPEVTASDVCAGEDLELQQIPPAGSRINGLGTALVTILATDQKSNQSTCKVTLTIEDRTPPQVRCPGGLTVKANGRCQAQVPDFRGGVVASDNCTAAAALVITQSPAPSALVGLGTNIVVITVTDASGNSATCQVTLTVVDQSDPIIWACGEGRTLEVNGQCTASVPDMTGDLVATDNCQGELKVEQDPSAGQRVEPGTHSVRITVTDDAGNSHSCTLPLTVVDVTAPAIKCPAMIVKNAPADLCATSAVVQPASAEDNCTDEDDLAIAGVRSDGQALAAAYPLGDTTITWSATDEAGNTSSCTQIVRVLDVTSPTLTCPANVNVDAEAGTCSAQVNPGQATARDSCDTNVAVKGVRNDGHDLDDPYPQGTTLITWTATDNVGNVRTCTQQVKVSNDNRLVLDIDLKYPVAAGTIERCITFELFDCGVKIETVEEEIQFVNGQARDQVIDIPCGTVWDCITAQDPLHTLRRRDSSITIAFNRFEADFIGPKGLIGGDLNDDGAVSVLDVVVFNSQLGTNFGSGDTECGDFDPHTSPHADINGDGVVNFSDHAIISAAMLSKDEQNCCGMGGVAGGEAPPVGIAGGTQGIDATRARRHPGTKGADTDVRAASEAGGSWFAAASWAGGIVPGPGAEVEVGSVLHLDAFGGLADTVRVASGGALVLSAGSLTVGHLIVETGAFLVLNDADALLTAGSLTIEPGATLRWLEGRIDVAGGAWHHGGALGVGVDGAGVLRVLDGGLVRAPEFSVGTWGEVTGDGTMDGDVTSAGLLRPGRSIGGLRIEGRLEQTHGATMLVEIGADGTGHIVVGGDARLDGALVVELLDGYRLREGEEVVIVTADRLMGRFTSVELPDVGPQLRLIVEHGADRVTLRVVPSPNLTSHRR